MGGSRDPQAERGCRAYELTDRDIFFTVVEFLFNRQRKESNARVIARLDELLEPQATSALRTAQRNALARHVDPRRCCQRRDPSCISLERIAECTVGEKDLGADLLQPTKKRGQTHHDDLDRGADHDIHRGWHNLTERLGGTAKDGEHDKPNHARHASPGTRNSDVAKRERNECSDSEVPWQ